MEALICIHVRLFESTYYKYWTYRRKPTVDYASLLSPSPGDLPITRWWREERRVINIGFPTMWTYLKVKNRWYVKYMLFWIFKKYIRFIDILIFQYLIRPCIGILHALYTYLLYEFLNIRRISDNEKTPFLSQSWKRAYLKGFCSWNIFSSILISTLQNPKIFFLTWFSSRFN